MFNVPKLAVVDFGKLAQRGFGVHRIRQVQSYRHSRVYRLHLVDAVQIAFAYADGGGWNFGYAVDNVMVFEPLDWDVAVTKFELERYLDYSVEFLSLIGKISAVYSQRFPDATVVQSSIEIESLCSDIITNVQQKLLVLAIQQNSTKNLAESK